MASKESSGKPVCLVCLETHDILKVVPACKHVFCRRCLSTHLESQGPSSESFPCPMCHAHSTLTEEGIDGLTDYDDEMCIEQISVEGGVQCGDGKMTDTASKQVHECGSCRFTRNSMVTAENLCDECGQLYLCVNCTKLHAKNPATASHVVSLLKTLKKNKNSVCKTHKKQINSFCCACSKPCCHLCVLLDHGEHHIKTIGDAFRSLVGDLKNATDEQEQRSTNLKKCEGQLKVLNESEVSRKKDALVQEIENHAEKYIEQILKQKDTLKEHVLTKYKVVTEVSEWIKKLPGLPLLDRIVPKAKQALLKAGPHPDDLQQLSVMLKQVADVRIEVDVDARLDGYWDTYRSLFQNPMSFVPKETGVNMGIGDMSVKERINNVKRQHILVYEKKLLVDNTAKFIPCVVILGNNFYAVAHPTLRGQASVGIDVYKFAGELQRTITDHVPPLYDMVATPDGQIAVLSDGATEGSCAVRLFAPKEGYTRTTKDFAVRGPLSFDITRIGQYAILSKDGGKSVITLFNEDGSVALTHLGVEADGVEEARRISCSASFIYLLGKMGVIAVYQKQGDRLVLVDVNKQYQQIAYNFMDISAVCLFDDGVAVCLNYTDTNIYLYRFAHDYAQPCKLAYARGNMLTTPNAESGLNTECHVSVRDDYIVWSRGNTIRVLKES